jgi:hypothetical protein
MKGCGREEKDLKYAKENRLRSRMKWKGRQRNVRGNRNRRNYPRSE